MIDVLEDLIEAAQQGGKSDTAEALKETVRVASRELTAKKQDRVSLN